MVFREKDSIINARNNAAKKTNKTNKTRRFVNNHFNLSAIAVFIMCITLIFSTCKVNAAGNLLPLASNNLKYYLIKNSSMAATDNGFVRVMNTDTSLYIEELDNTYNVTSRKTIEKELSIYGGFFSGSDAYYIVFGENNKEEKNDAEVVRVVKYSKNWIRLGAAKLTGDTAFGHQIRYPFDYGNVSMSEYNGKLYIVTGHEGYVDPQYNQGHQGFLMFEVDESTMTGSIKKADLWHSFSQHLAINDSGEIYVLEESDGDRMTKVTRYNAANTTSTRVPVLEYGGSHTSAWAIATCATANAIALSDKNVLAVGCSIDQTRYDDTNYTKTYNIYLTVTPQNDFTQAATTVKWLTNDNLSSRYRDIKLTKINDNKFLLMWEQNGTEESIETENDYDSMSRHVLHYMFLDGSGNVLGTEKKVAAAISECEPVLKDGKVYFYSSDGSCVAFYSIDASTGAFNKKLYKLAGENATWDYSDGTLTISGMGELYANMGSTAFGAIKDKVTKLIVSDGITKISDKAFYGLSNVSEVTLGKDITSIGSNAFGYCGFKDIRIPYGAESIGDKAFYGNRTLRNVYIPKTVTTIGEDLLWTGYYWTGSGGKVVYATIICEKDSTAYTYATDGNIKFAVPGITLTDKTEKCSGKVVEIGEAKVTGITSNITYKYYTDSDCTVETTAEGSGAAGLGKAPVKVGTYYVKAFADKDDVFFGVVSNVATISINHDLEEVAEKCATCTEDGNVAHFKCTGCGMCFSDGEGKNVLEKVKIDAMGHDYRNSYVWSNDGLSCRATAVCKNDNRHKVIEDGNINEEVVKKVTCEEAGKSIFTASFNSEVFTSQSKEVEYNSLGHDYGPWTVNKEAKEDESGEYIRVCSHDSSHYETMEIPMLSHHHDLSPVDAEPATCEKDGKKSYYACSGCNLIFEDIEGTTEIVDERILIIKGGHRGGTATCCAKAVCSLCGQEYGEIDANNHIEDIEIKDEKAATCTKEGFSGDKYCAGCHELLEEGSKTDPKGHTKAAAVKENVINATCTLAGIYDNVIYCSDCGTELERETKTTNALGHDYGSWTVTKKATTYSTGVETCYCSRNRSHKKTRVIPKLQAEKPITDSQDYYYYDQPADIGESIVNGDDVYVVVDDSEDEPAVAYKETDGNDKDVVIPNTVTIGDVEYNVVSIADGAFEGNVTVKTITVGNNIEYIGAGAFKDCKNLTKVNIGINVDEIGDKAFENCKALTKVTIPASVNKIGNSVFNGCKKLKTITIKSKKLNKKNVSKKAFKGIGKKTVIKVPKSKKKAYIKLFRKKGLSKKVKIK